MWMKRLISLIVLVLLALGFTAIRSGLANGPTPVARDTTSAGQESSNSMAVDSAGTDSMTVGASSANSVISDTLAVDSPAGDSLGRGEATAESLAQGPAIITLGELREVPNKAFGVGERLIFEISYGPIKAGTAVMEVKEVVPLNDRDCYHVISTARSNRFFSSFFKVEDRVESFFDARGLFTWRFEQHLREGEYRADRFAHYDQLAHTVTTNRGTMDIPPYVQDVLSTLYYVRTQHLEVGQVLYVTNHSGRKIYPLAVRVHRRELVKVPSGTFDCFVVEPMLKAGGLFKHEGRIWVWLTADQKKMPVLMKTKVIIGTIDAKLKSYKLGRIS
jgi:hypothetical protein